MGNIGDQLCFQSFRFHFLVQGNGEALGNAVQVFTVLAERGKHPTGIDFILQIAVGQFFAAFCQFLQLGCNGAENEGQCQIQDNGTKAAADIDRRDDQPCYGYLPHGGNGFQCIPEPCKQSAAKAKQAVEDGVLIEVSAQLDAGGAGQDGGQCQYGQD